MGLRRKIRYEIDLTGRPESVGLPPGVRRIERSDNRDLAQLMLDAYAGTIDSGGESFEDALDEVEAFFGARPLLQHSFVMERNDSVLSAVLVSIQELHPLIGSVTTQPAYRNQGLAASVAASALDSLKSAGFSTVVLYITEGNIQSEALFAKFGATAVGPSS